MAAAALKLLALTGMRRQEAVKLMWSEYDRAGSCLHLGDTKTGRSTRPLGAAAAALLDAWAASGTHPTLVFPNARGNGPVDLEKKLAAIFDAAGLQGVRSHALRSTFASADSIARGFGRDIAAEGLRLAAGILQGRLQAPRPSAYRYRRGGTGTPA
jgi:integrase